MQRNIPLARQPLKATFSIVAADPSTGQVGVGVQSKYFAVGAVVPWARAGVGAVATQARGLARYGPAILDAMAHGLRPAEALTAELASDPLAPERQIGVVAADGATASHTGANCMPWAGAVSGPCFSVQGNILTAEHVVQEMAQAFTESTGPLAERLLSSLEAGQTAGGDRRGQQSAALLVEQQSYRDIGIEGIDCLVDLRVDDHPEPIRELRRLLRLWQIEEANEQGLLRYNKRDYAAAVDIMAAANTKFPGTARILYNLACFESLLGHPDESLRHLKEAIAQDATFREAAQRETDFDPVRSTPAFLAMTQP